MSSPKGRFDHRRTTGKDLTCALGDHAEMAEAGNWRETAGRRAEDCGGDGRDIEDLAVVPEKRAIRNVGPAQVGELRHAAACAVDQVDRR